MPSGVINIADKLSAQECRERWEQEQQNCRDLQEATMRSWGQTWWIHFLHSLQKNLLCSMAPSQPPYSIADIEADSQYEDLFCPLANDLPPIRKMVMWQNHIYNKDHLKTYRESISSTGERLVFQTRDMKNPMTGQRLGTIDFYEGDRALTPEGRATHLATIQSYYYTCNEAHSLLTQYNALILFLPNTMLSPQK